MLSFEKQHNQFHFLRSYSFYIYTVESAAEDRQSESWNQPINHSKHNSQQTSALPAQLPAGAYFPSCTGK